MTYIAGALCADAHGVPDDRLEILWLCATRVSQVYLMMQTDGGHAPMRVKGVEHRGRIECTRRPVTDRGLAAFCNIGLKPLFLNK